jgi:hypothetical protein
VALLQCHKAKNLVPEKKMKPTKTGKAVLDIQVCSSYSLTESFQYHSFSLCEQ